MQQLGQQQKAKLVEQMIAAGGRIGPLPDGPRLATFDALQMAQAIEYELNRCAAVGWPKINITMSTEDAALVAAYLRRASSTVR